MAFRLLNRSPVALSPYLTITSITRTHTTSSQPQPDQTRNHSVTENLVSFLRAPGFSQAPKETIGLPPKDVPPHLIQAYVIPNVITEAEEDALLRFSRPWFDRLPYASNHADQLIHQYKEFYRPYDGLMQDDTLLCLQRSQQQSDNNTKNENCVAHHQKDSSFSKKGEGELMLSPDTLAAARSALTKARHIAHTHLKHIPLQNRVHFLQLHGDGFIRGHVDESRNSSGIVAGLTLGSGRVMTLTHPDKYPGVKIDLCLRPRAFYVLTGTARYEWLHSVDWIAEDETEKSKRGVRVVEGSEVLFEGKPTGMKRQMRTAVIFRGVSPMELLMSKMNVPHRHA